MIMMAAVTVNLDRNKTITAEYVAITHKLSILSEISGGTEISVDVSLDGNPLGVTPINNIDAYDSQHTITVPDGPIDVAGKRYRFDHFEEASP